MARNVKRTSFFVWPEILDLCKRVAEENQETLADYLRGLMIRDLEERGLLDRETLLEILKGK